MQGRCMVARLLRGVITCGPSSPKFVRKPSHSSMSIADSPFFVLRVAFRRPAAEVEKFLAMGESVILTENDTNDSKITV